MAPHKSASSKCQASIEASVALLDISMGRVMVPAETTLWGVLLQCFTKFQSIFTLSDNDGILSDSSGLKRILGAIFDTDSRAFVTEDSLRILAGLNDKAKTCLFAQAVAGMALLFQRFSLTDRKLSGGLLTRELQLFAESEQRREMLDKIAHSSLLEACYIRGAFVDMLLATIGAEVTDKHPNTAAEYLLNDSMACVSDRPCSNMGLPWGFTIMAIN
ncbi:hypothetical protein QBC46DRAFT_388470 [Diplogelasinospora grovesii]|uniref:Uncharacterized protein n=1 Tax=Diplogelasinospora grovesii TaxID=303347 RepID=A0AAN6N6N9_9PEZI|nr:hypothetical protein QBC46DRAFT_388470 [Diplogelasinospora grovesii]